MKPYLFLHIPKSAGSSISECLPYNRCTILNFLDQNKDNNDFFNFGYAAPRHHYTIEQYAKIGVTIPKEVYKFTFVRNPWDRVVSLFHEWKRLNQIQVKYENKIYDVEPSDDSFFDFVKNVLFDALRNNSYYRPTLRCKFSIPGVTSKVYEKTAVFNDFQQPIKECPFYYTIANGHFTPQIKYTHDLSGNQIVDFVGKYENLQEDFNKLNKILDWGIPELKIPYINQSKRLKKNYRDYYNDGTGLTKELVYDIYQEDVKTYNYVF